MHATGMVPIATNERKVTTMKKRYQGFTLVEIMIVVAIIAILAAVAIPNFVRYRKTAQKNACISNLKQIQAAFEQAKLNGTATPGWADIVGTDKYIKVSPTCPAEGQNTYSLPENDAANPTCSHSEDQAEYKHEIPTAAAATP